jgi:DNA processing protein
MESSRVPDAENHIRASFGSGKSHALQSVVGLLALLRLPRVGPKTALRIALTTNYDAFIEQQSGLWDTALKEAEAELDACERADVRVLSVFDDNYPARLRTIHDPPPVLYIHGSIEVLNEARSAAVVGTREPTQFGCSATEELTAALAGEKWAVVSGLARGIDALAHGAALKHHTPTVAVLAGGLDDIYPKENRELAAAIVDQGGALISEAGLGKRPRAASFVARNRLQTGLAAAVVVAQTGLKGGTMHTARHAASQGRAIFCPKPHSRHEKNAGLWELLESPARELCSRLPAWRDSPHLCERLGDQPLAHPVDRDEIPTFLALLNQCIEDPQTTPTPRWWPPSSADEPEDALRVDETDEMVLFE